SPTRWAATPAPMAAATASAGVHIQFRCSAAGAVSTASAPPTTTASILYTQGSSIAAVRVSSSAATGSCQVAPSAYVVTWSVYVVRAVFQYGRAARIGAPTAGMATQRRTRAVIAPDRPLASAGPRRAPGGSKATEPAVAATAAAVMARA